MTPGGQEGGKALDLEALGDDLINAGMVWEAIPLTVAADWGRLLHAEAARVRELEAAPVADPEIKELRDWQSKAADILQRFYTAHLPREGAWCTWAELEKVVEAVEARSAPEAKPEGPYLIAEGSLSEAELETLRNHRAKIELLPAPLSLEGAREAPLELEDLVADLMRRHGPDGHIDGHEIIAQKAWEWMRALQSGHKEGEATREG